MKSRTSLILAVMFLFSATISLESEAQVKEYKLTQTNSVSGMKTTSTIYVKGKRKRTEGGGMMGIGENLVTIEQCDLQRYIKLNTKKKLYFIEPFSKNEEEVIDEDAKTVPVKKTVTQPKTTKQGGTITMYYTITDTGERKQMYGFTARHIWTTMKMVPSKDACTMKDSFLMKTDGWYIDLPDWNCPVRYASNVNSGGPGQKPDCLDKFVTRRKGNGKLAFPLIEIRTIYMNDGKGKTTEFVTNLETIELTTAKLDTMLFTIPPGYTETKNEQDLQDAFDVNAYMDQMKKQQDNNNNDDNNPSPVSTSGEKQAGMLRIGVYVPTGGESLDGSSLQQHLAMILRSDKIDAVAVADEAEAKSRDCDMVLSTNFTRVKQASKVGGIIKAIKNTDPNAASSWNIDADLKVTNLGDGSVRTQQSVSGKYNGQPDAAAKLALGDGSVKVLKALK